MKIRIFTEDVSNDAQAEKLAKRVEEMLVDHPAAKVIWLQDPLPSESMGRSGRVRLTAIVTWRD